jgi:hypothetical protein
MEIILTLLLLQIKHYCADFRFQSYSQTVTKGNYGNLVGLSHSLDHFIFTLGALLIVNLWYPLTVSSILLVGICESVLHYHIDWLKVKFGTKNLQSPQFWHEFGLDQLAHQLTYLAIAWYLWSV